MPNGTIHEALETKVDRIAEQLEHLNDKTKKRELTIMLLTAVIGFFVWYSQSLIQRHIDENAKELETRLAIVQEFYKRKLTTYEIVHRRTADLINALSDVQFNPSSKKLAVDASHSLYTAYTTNSLYLGDDLVRSLAQLVDMGNRLPALDGTGNVTMRQIDDQVSLIEQQMKEDLRVREIGTIPGPKGSSSH
jgi:hypothetical protein